MSILSKVTWKAMWQNRVRTVVTIIGVILSAAMFIAVTTMGVSSWDYLRRGYTYEIGDWFLALDYVTDESLTALEQKETVTQVIDLQVLGYTGFPDAEERENESFYVAAVDADFFSAMPVRLLEGRLPENSTEILLPYRYPHWYDFRQIPFAIGDTITLQMRTKYSPDPKFSFEDNLQDEQWNTEYTVVGIIENDDFYDGLYAFHAFTLQDENAPSALWHRVFLKTAPVDAVFDLEQKGYGEISTRNNSLLQIYGATRYANISSYLAVMCVILVGIIMVASVSLISNAFSISVSERTKQFGLLAGIGATRKQIRYSLLFEAGVLCAIGIPIGLLSGYCAIMVILRFLGHAIEVMFSFGVNGAVRITAVPSGLGFGAAAAVCVVTVLISAWIPARRAARITPMEAIRQSSDYSVPAKAVQVSGVTYRLWGLSGVLATKYYKTSRKKYRATVVSLAVSIVLFITANYFCDIFASVMDANINYENFDMMCFDTEHFQELRENPNVAEAAYVDEAVTKTLLPGSAFSDGYSSYMEGIHESFSRDSYNVSTVMVYYLEDAALERYLLESDIAPEPYLDAENPTALVCVRDYTTYYMQNADGEWGRYTYHTSPLTAQVKELMLLDNMPYPWELMPDAELDSVGWTNQYSTDEEGNLLLVLTKLVSAGNNELHEEEVNCYQIEMEDMGSGETLYRYYRYDPESKTVEAKPAAELQQEGRITSIPLGAVIEKMPFGITSYDRRGSIDLILPLSALPEDRTPDLALKVSDYYAVKAVLDSYDKPYNDYLAAQMNNRGFLLLINVLSYGFIALIALISTANVFNTISTNIALRRRDFGMLRSIGLQDRELHRMMHYECLLYGSRAVLFGLPLSLLLTFGIYQVSGFVYSVEYQVPWTAAVIASGCVFLIVFVSMLYAVSKLRKDTPIEAIRMDNI